MPRTQRRHRWAGRKAATDDAHVLDITACFCKGDHGGVLRRATEIEKFTESRPAQRLDIVSQAAVKGRLYGLDAMRGIAAILVLLFHVGQVVPSSILQASHGYLAVDLFFMLSGFVIAQAYEKRLALGLSLREFTIIRLIRLYPLYIVGIALGCLVFVLQIARHSDNAPPLMNLLLWALTNAVFLPAPNATLLFPLNAAAWSLLFEILVNLAFAAILFKSSRQQLALLIAICAAILFFYCASHASLNAGWGRGNAVVGLARTGFAFPIGMLLFRARVGRPHIQSWARFFLPNLALLPLLTMDFGHSDAAWSDLLIVLLIFPPLVLVVASSKTPAGFEWISGFVGDVSYPLYAIHLPLLMLAAEAGWAPDSAATAFTLAFTTLSVALAILLSRFYDAPIRSRISRTIGRRESAPPQTDGSSAE